MRLVICWSDISGYMAACWRALAALPGVEAHVIATEASGRTFNNDLIAGLHVKLIPQDRREDLDLIRALVRERRPDVLYTSGWSNPAYRAMAASKEFLGVPKWMGVDTPYLGTLRQQVGRVVLRRYVARMDKVFVAGERAWQYLRALGAPEARLRRGLYGVDHEALAPAHAQRCADPRGWPKRFLFIGRYVEEKGIPTLVRAYARYRGSVSDPWPLTTCGVGPMTELLRADGIDDLGFRQPAEMREIMLRHGALVLSSHFDPWPLVVVEAAAAGLPVACTEACGSAVELVRPYHNGLTVATGDPDALARALIWLHERHAELPRMGERGRELASGYSAQAWALRWTEAARESAGRPLP